MYRRIKYPVHVLTLIAVVFTTAAVLDAQTPETAKIPAGSYHSVLPEVVGEPVEVNPFRLEVTAVTNRQFVEFLKENPQWRRSQVPAIYAGSGYLNHWEKDLEPGDHINPEEPVTRVSWFAANSYCDWKGGRLPTLNEWEYAAQAMDFHSEKEADRFSTNLIGWYSSVDANYTEVVGSTGIENRYGVKDMFGLVMEWVEDFQPPVGNDISLDCGTVGRMKGDSSIYSYAMSIRFITRMSFKPTSTTGMLGFRCAYDVEKSL